MAIFVNMLEGRLFDLMNTFTDGVLQLVRILALRKEYAIDNACRQLIRCSSSIGANVTEAHGAGTRPDFRNFFQIALKSARESDYWLSFLLRTVPEQHDRILSLKDYDDQICRILSVSIKKLRLPGN